MALATIEGLDVALIPWTEEAEDLRRMRRTSAGTLASDRAGAAAFARRWPWQTDRASMSLADQMALLAVLTAAGTKTIAGPAVGDDPVECHIEGISWTGGPIEHAALSFVAREVTP